MTQYQETSAKTAVLLAADFIEDNPDQFDFWAFQVPDCKSPGCIMGWIGFFKGFQPRATNIEVCEQVFGTTETGNIYHELNRINKDLGFGIPWQYNPAVAAACLREYAHREL